MGVFKNIRIDMIHGEYFKPRDTIPAQIYDTCVEDGFDVGYGDYGHYIELNEFLGRED